jgi:hypothetical protein
MAQRKPLTLHSSGRLRRRLTQALGRHWNLMFLTYTQMDKAGTRRMHRFGLPLYAFTLFVCLVTSSRGAIWFFGVVTVVGLLYTFLYSKLYVHFMGHPELPRRHFIASLMLIEVAIGLLLATVAA